MEKSQKGRTGEIVAEISLICLKEREDGEYWLNSFFLKEAEKGTPQVKDNLKMSWHPNPQNTT